MAFVFNKNGETINPATEESLAEFNGHARIMMLVFFMMLMQSLKISNLLLLKRL